MFADLIKNMIYLWIRIRIRFLYSHLYIQIYMWKMLCISKTFQNILLKKKVFQWCLIAEKFYYIILCVNLDIIYVLFLLFYPSTSFLKPESYVLSYLNIKYSRHYFITDAVNLQNYKILKSIFSFKSLNCKL